MGGEIRSMRPRKRIAKIVLKRRNLLRKGIPTRTQCRGEKKKVLGLGGEKGSPHVVRGGEKSIAQSSKDCETKKKQTNRGEKDGEGSPF